MGGAATKNEIADEIMRRNELQIEHYRRNIGHQMPGQHLVGDGVIVQDREQYRLAPPFDRLSEWQRLELAAVCERRIEEHRAAYDDLFAKRNIDALFGDTRYHIALAPLL